MIVGIINRQCTPFNEAKIKEMVLYHSAGAKIEIKVPEIEDLIKTRLDTLVRNDFVSYRRGEYYPRSMVRDI